MQDAVTFEVPVDYDDATLGRFDEIPFFNHNPHVGQEHFHRSFTSGKIIFTLGYTPGFENGATTEEVLAALDQKSGSRPDLVTTLEFMRLFPEERQKHGVVSFCGKIIRLNTIPFVVYLNADASGLSAFLNWMNFRRGPGVEYLKVLEWELTS